MIPKKEDGEKGGEGESIVVFVIKEGRRKKVI